VPVISVILFHKIYPLSLLLVQIAFFLTTPAGVTRSPWSPLFLRIFEVILFSVSLWFFLSSGLCDVFSSPRCQSLFVFFLLPLTTSLSLMDDCFPCCPSLSLSLHGFFFIRRQWAEKRDEDFSPFFSFRFFVNSAATRALCYEFFVCPRSVSTFSGWFLESVRLRLSLIVLFFFFLLFDSRPVLIDQRLAYRQASFCGIVLSFLLGFFPSA